MIISIPVIQLYSKQVSVFAVHSVCTLVGLEWVASLLADWHCYPDCNQLHDCLQAAPQRDYSLPHGFDSVFYWLPAAQQDPFDKILNVNCNSRNI